MITEGQVRAGDEIVRTRVGRHALSVADIDALLYLPGRDLERLRAAVDMPALSPGWQQSFRELLDGTPRTGRARPRPPVGVEPGWPGFRRLRVAELVPETATVTSVYLAAEDGRALPAALAGQYLTLRAAGAGDPAPVRSYSLSSTPGADTYRISVKREPHGLVSTLPEHRAPAGPTLDVAAPRGEFVLTDDAGPVLLVSAGVGATPVLAMLHQLAAANSSRDVWWIHAARDASQHAFAAEAHQLLQSLPSAHERIFYTAPDADPPPGSPVIRGRPTLAALAGLDLPPARDRVPLRAGGVHGRHARHPRRARRRAGPGAHRAVRRAAADQPRRHRHRPAGSAPAARTTGHRPAGHLRPQRADRALVRPGPVPAGAGRRLRRADPVVLPDRRLPHLRHADPGRRRHLRPDPLEPPGPDEVLVCCSQPDSDVVLDL